MKHISFALALIACIVAFSSVRLLPNVGRTIHHDWGVFFRPQALDPYSKPGMYPPWVFTALLPLAVLPVHLGYGALVTLSLLIIVKYTGKWWRTLLLVLCQPVMECLFIGQIDCLMILAFMAPPNLTLLVTACKPQAMLAYGLRRSTKTGLVILSSVILLSLAIWGNWPARLSGTDLAWGWNQFKYAMIPIGIVLVLNQKELLWLAGGALITPFLLPYHLTPLLAYVYKRERWWVLVLVTLSTWAAKTIGVMK